MYLYVCIASREVHLSVKEINDSRPYDAPLSLLIPLKTLKNFISLTYDVCEFSPSAVEYLQEFPLTMKISYLRILRNYYTYIHIHIHIYICKCEIVSNSKLYISKRFFLHSSTHLPDMVENVILLLRHVYI